MRAADAQQPPTWCIWGAFATQRSLPCLHLSTSFHPACSAATSCRGRTRASSTLPRWRRPSRSSSTPPTVRSVAGWSSAMPWGSILESGVLVNVSVSAMLSYAGVLAAGPPTPPNLGSRPRPPQALPTTATSLASRWCAATPAPLASGCPTASGASGSSRSCLGAGLVVTGVWCLPHIVVAGASGVALQRRALQQYTSPH